jgi:hypothetical protein
MGDFIRAAEALTAMGAQIPGARLHILTGSSILYHGFSIWDLLFVTFLASRILRQHITLPCRREYIHSRNTFSLSDKRVRNSSSSFLLIFGLGSYHYYFRCLQIYVYVFVIELTDILGLFTGK